MKNFKIGKEIKTILVSDTTVYSKLGNKIFPIVADLGTKFPFLVYRRTSFRPYNNKDYTDEAVYMDLLIVSQSYEQSVDIADVVADALDKKSTNTIDEINIVNIHEDYIDDSYTQVISIEILLH